MSTRVPLAGDFVNGDVSFWYRSLGVPAAGAPLDGDLDADVAIVGAGYTGLWTAYYLKKAGPGLRIVVLEQEFAGFGASGRNGGWLVGELAGSPERYAKTPRARTRPSGCSGRCSTTVDEVIARRRGTRASTPTSSRAACSRRPQRRPAARLRECSPTSAHWGWTEEDVRLLDPAERPSGCGWPGPSARLDARTAPASSPPSWSAAWPRPSAPRAWRSSSAPPSPRSPRGAARHRRTARSAPRYVIRATEGFTAGLQAATPGMAADEQLDDRHRAAAGDAVGRDRLGRPRDCSATWRTTTCTPSAPPTAGSRSAGAASPTGTARGWTTGATPMSGRSRRSRTADTTVPRCCRRRGSAHTWSGVLGVPRDWCATVHVDHATGLGWAGGYTGHGVDHDQPRRPYPARPDPAARTPS